MLGIRVAVLSQRNDVVIIAVTVQPEPASPA